LNSLIHSKVLSLLKCTHCGGKLISQNNEKLFCSSCFHKYTIKDMIPDFLEKDYYMPFIPRDVSRKFIQLSREKGIDNVLNMDFMKDYENWFTKYVFDYSMADWKVIVPISGQDKILLDIGCGYGTLSIPFSEMFGHVIAVDPVYEHLEILDLKQKELGIDNIIPIRANAVNLPLKDSSIDAILMMGVLEWTGESIHDIKVPLLHSKILSNLYNILNKDGLLILGIENRVGYKYFLGEKDEHSHLKYTNLMPRIIANIISNVRRGVNSGVLFQNIDILIL